MDTEEFDRLALAVGRNVLIAQKEILTLEEVMLYTGMSRSHLYKLTSRRLIPHYKPNGKVCFFRRKELEQWLTSNRVATEQELDDAAYRLDQSLKNKRDQPKI